MSTGDEGQDTLLAAATTGAGTHQGTAGAGAGVDGFLRDHDPPPGDPETTFRAFEKSLKLWQLIDVPLRKQSAKPLRALTGAARLALEELEYEQIASEGGIKNLVNRLREYFAPHLQVSMPRAFETAVYGQPRQSKETYAVRSQNATQLAWTFPVAPRATPSSGRAL